MLHSNAQQNRISRRQAEMPLDLDLSVSLALRHRVFFAQVRRMSVSKGQVCVQVGTRHAPTSAS